MCHKLAFSYKRAHEIANTCAERKKQRWKVERCRRSNNKRLKKTPSRVYYCEECRSWHLTSNKVANRRKPYYEPN
jgi:late competence protein required for DNA uptake (superfamily II DNA/RNA helicase)